MMADNKIMDILYIIATNIVGSDIAFEILLKPTAWDNVTAHFISPLFLINIH